MFDTIVIHYPLPGIEGDPSKASYQTKSLDCALDNYVISQNGELFHEKYDIEDRSDRTKKGIEGLHGLMTRVNNRWEPCPFTGEVRFYNGEWAKNPDFSDGKILLWIEFSAYFVNGQLKELHRSEDARILREQRDSDGEQD